MIDYGNGFSVDADRLAAICQRFNVRRLDVFGSATGSTFDPDSSDVDLIAEFGPEPHGMTAFTQFFQFQIAMETLFQHSVDLLEDDAVENPYLRESIERRRRTLF